MARSPEDPAFEKLSSNANIGGRLTFILPETLGLCLSSLDDRDYSHTHVDINVDVLVPAFENRPARRQALIQRKYRRTAHFLSSLDDRNCI